MEQPRPTSLDGSGSAPLRAAFPPPHAGRLTALLALPALFSLHFIAPNCICWLGQAISALLVPFCLGHAAHARSAAESMIGLMQSSWFWILVHLGLKYAFGRSL